MPDLRQRTAPLDHAATLWSPRPDFASVTIERDGWAARSVTGLSQCLVSGNLAAARKAFAPDALEMGLWSIATSIPILVRIARDRALIVGHDTGVVPSGWRPEGFAASDATDLYAVVEIAGPAMRDIVAQATAADLDSGSPSATVVFAGLQALLYRVDEQAARIHVETSQATALWHWLEKLPG
ncbi:MAG: hypothetical protein K5872_16840 [Rhizobiaceae bacterium]|nr:hypothetical protein [Rhizobiaceae bacterium]MCV0407891.1 hypothetical protein [Rhizobiaceae bacterium]